MKPNLRKKYLFPLWVALSNEISISYLNELERTQWLSSAELRDLQWIKLKQLLRHAYQNSPYYNKILNELKLHPDDIKCYSDFQKIPFLDKHIIQNNTNGLIAKNYSLEDLYANSSGGSTGLLTNFYQDNDRRKYRAGDEIRHNRWSGWDVGEKIAYLWGSRKDISKSESIRNRVKNLLYSPSITLDSFNMSEDLMYTYAKALNKFRPSLIVAYANSIYIFSKFLHANKIDCWSPKGIITSAETLSDFKREMIELVFGTKVYNRYGSREVGLIASECCKHEGLHINGENVIVEVIEGKIALNNVREGEIVVTDLMNFGMPIIRYRLGDIGTINNSSVCSCGRGLPLLNSIHGRTSDFIITTDRRMIHGEYFTHLFYGKKNIKQFQFIQENESQIMLKIVPHGEINQAEILEIRKKIIDCLGEGMNIGIQIVKHIPVSASGKYQFTISKFSNF